MGGLNSSLLAIVALLVTVGVGWVAIHILRTGFDYVSARGNPRNRAGAHDALWDIGKGALLIIGAAAIAAIAFQTIKI
jgi:hypothetical protein